MIDQDDDLCLDQPSSIQDVKSLVNRALKQIRVGIRTEDLGIFERSVIDQVPTQLVAQQYEVTSAYVRKVFAVGFCTDCENSSATSSHSDVGMFDAQEYRNTRVLMISPKHMRSIPGINSIHPRFRSAHQLFIGRAIDDLDRTRSSEMFSLWGSTPHAWAIVLEIQVR